ncbi:MAG: NMD3-related protein [Acidilobus sp.]
MPEKICPMCGRSSREVPFIGNLCKDCFVKRYGVAVAPQSLDFTYCPSCFAHRDRGRWSSPYDDVRASLTDYILSQLTPRVRPVQPLEEVAITDVKLGEGDPPRTAFVTVEGRYGDVRVSSTLVITITPHAVLCPVCASRKTGGGYTAVAQIRSYPRPLEEDQQTLGQVKRLIGSIGDEVVKVEEVKEGIDVYLRDHSSARSLAARLRAETGARVIETFKGTRARSRLYVSIRIPTIRPGDVIDVDRRPLFYLTSTPRGFLFIDLATGGKKVMTPDELWASDFKLYEGPDVRRAMLLSRAGGKYVFFWDGGSVEVPEKDVVILTEEVAEGQEFLVYLSSRKLYVIGRAKEGKPVGPEEGRGK